MANKKYRPKKGYEEMTLTTSLPDSAEDLVVDGDSWPYETESPTEQAALDAHPWVTDKPLPEPAKASVKPETKSNSKEGA